MTRLRKRLLPAAVAALLLTGCASTAPSPTPTESGQPAPSGPASPSADPVADPSATVVGSERFTVVDDDGRLLIEFAWADDPGSIVGDLDEVFGMTATASVTEGDGSHFPAFDVYTWETFALSIARLGDRPRDSYFLPAAVTAHSAAVGPIEIRTGDGLGVGSTVAEVLETDPPVQEPAFQGGTLYRVDPSEPERIGGSEPTRMVELASDPAENRIVRLSAPVLSFSPF